MLSINPTTEEPIAEYADHTEEAVDLALARAAEAFVTWRQRSFAERAACMRRLGEIIESCSGELAILMAEEMGKPVTGGEAEARKCAACCHFYAENAEKLLSPELVQSDAHRSLVRYDPLGAIFAIMPWNFPLWQVIRFIAPALMAGNVGLLKHSENVPGCALEVEEMVREAGFPEGCFATLLIRRTAADRVIKDPRVAAVTLTGSEGAGKAVASAAGSVLKKCVLELGGSDPFIVLPDADPEAVARSAAEARCINSGQSCIAAKRFLVHESIAPRFAEALIAAMRAMRVGDPLDRSTQVGPMARRDLVEELDAQVRRSVKWGARLATGGHRPSRRGFFYEPTVLLDVRPGCPAFDEETFGPVAAVTRYADVDEAIDLANASPFGLGASIWSSSPDSAAELAPRIDAGAVFINGIVKSDPRLPFGGIKRSGYGRELAALGPREFCNIKTVWIGK